MRHPNCLTVGRIFCGILAIAMLTGCASQRKNAATAAHKLDREESAFAAGANRSPSAETSYAFAKILVAQGRDSDALYVLSRTVRESPKFIPAYNEMAKIYLRSDRFKDAIGCLDTALQRSPHDPILHNNRGLCLLLHGDSADALKAFRSASQLAPTNPTYRANYALALALSGRDREAAEQYRTVISNADTQKNLTVLAKAREQQSKLATP